MQLRGRMPARKRSSMTHLESSVIEQDGLALLVGGFGDAGCPLDYSCAVVRDRRVAARGPGMAAAYELQIPPPKRSWPTSFGPSLTISRTRFKQADGEDLA